MTVAGPAADATRFAPVADLLDAAVRDRVTPAATLEIGGRHAIHFQYATGALTYEPSSPRCAADTIFDLASLTKVMATTTLAMQIAEQDAAWCDTPIAALEPRWRGEERSAVTVHRLLDHSSGLPAHVKLFEVARGREAFLERIVTTPLAFAPGTESRYSDLGFILLGLLIEARLGAALDAALAPIAALLDGPLLFTPPAALMSRVAPTERDPWRGRTLQGEVHDENASALGGVAGHAGLFGTARAVGSFAQLVLRSFVGDTSLARASTMRKFAERSTVPGSSRALGWDTMLPSSSCGTLMSPRAIGHTGFTGTSLWIDPANDVYVALLTNRVHPSREGEGIQPLRRAVSDAAMLALSR